MLGGFGLVLIVVSWSAGARIETTRRALAWFTATYLLYVGLSGPQPDTAAVRHADAGVHHALVPGDGGRARPGQPQPRPTPHAAARVARAQRPTAARARHDRLPRPAAGAPAHRPGHARQPRPPTRPHRRPHRRPGGGPRPHRRAARGRGRAAAGVGGRDARTARGRSASCATAHPKPHRPDAGELGPGPGRGRDRRAGGGVPGRGDGRGAARAAGRPRRWPRPPITRRTGSSRRR